MNESKKIMEQKINYNSLICEFSIPRTIWGPLLANSIAYATITNPTPVYTESAVDSDDSDCLEEMENHKTQRKHEKQKLKSQIVSVVKRNSPRLCSCDMIMVTSLSAFLMFEKIRYYFDVSTMQNVRHKSYNRPNTMMLLNKCGIILYQDDNIQLLRNLNKIKQILTDITRFNTDDVCFAFLMLCACSDMNIRKLDGVKLGALSDTINTISTKYEGTDQVYIVNALETAKNRIMRMKEPVESDPSQNVKKIHNKILKIVKEQKETCRTKEQTDECDYIVIEELEPEVELEPELCDIKTQSSVTATTKPFEEEIEEEEIEVEYTPVVQPTKINPKVSVNKHNFKNDKVDKVVAKTPKTPKTNSIPNGKAKKASLFTDFDDFECSSDEHECEASSTSSLLAKPQVKPQVLVQTQFGTSKSSGMSYSNKPSPVSYNSSNVMSYTLEEPKTWRQKKILARGDGTQQRPLQLR